MSEDRRGPKRKLFAEFGEMLGRALEAADRSTGWLAGKLGIDASMVRKYRDGVNTPDNAKLALIIQWLEMDLHDACRACGRDPEAVAAVGVVARSSNLPRLILDLTYERFPAIHTNIVNGKPAEAQSELTTFCRLLDEATKEAPDLAGELSERHAWARYYLLGTLRETQVAERAPSRGVDLAPRALVDRSRPNIAALHQLADERESPAILGQAYLAAGHMHYVAHNSPEALKSFQRALAYEHWMTNDDLIMALRTMALAAAYLVVRRHPGGGRHLPEYYRELVNDIGRWTRRVRRRIEACKFGDLHSAMTALEGVSRACGMVGLDQWFYDAMSEAEYINAHLEETGAVYPLPRVQRQYARLTVYKVRGERLEFERLMRKALASVDGAQYPRHRQQIEDIERESFSRGWGRSLRARTMVAPGHP